jgi:hypothetical protein
LDLTWKVVWDSPKYSLHNALYPIRKGFHKTSIFHDFASLISTHFSGAVQTPYGIASVNPRLYPLTNAFNMHFWGEKSAINAYLSTTCPYNDQSHCKLLSATCPPLPVHYLSFWYCSEIFSDLSNYRQYLSTICPLDNVVRYSVTSPTINCLPTTCPPLVLQIL